MSYRFTPSQQELREKTAAFVAREIPREVAQEVDRRDEYPHELMKKLGEQGFWKINIPKKYGGDEGNIIDMMIFSEEIAKALPVLTFAAGNVQLYGSNILIVNGNDAQRDEYLPRLAKGELKFCFGLTEPDSGSDAGNIRMSAVPDGNDYVLNGAKIFTSGASVADISITHTRTASDRYGGITSFLVDTRSPGYRATPLKKLGSKGSDTCEVYYENVRVSRDNILGGPECVNTAWPQMMRLLNGERLGLSATTIGIMDTVVNECVVHIRKRKQRVGSSIRLQELEHKIAEMATLLEAARQLAYNTASMMVNGVNCIKETAMCKYFCAETGKKVSLMGLEVMGADGYTMASSVQHLFRDISLLTIGGGTSQIQKNVIAKQLGL